MLEVIASYVETKIARVEDEVAYIEAAVSHVAPEASHIDAEIAHIALVKPTQRLQQHMYRL